MYDLNQMTDPALQDWWERYVCPTCMSKQRNGWGLCADSWHAIPAVTYECPKSSLSPLSIPVTELQQAGLLGRLPVRKYGRTWTPAAAVARRPAALGYA